MPTYEWRCRDCREIYSETMPLAEYETRTTIWCPCGGRLKRIFDVQVAPQTRSIERGLIEANKRASELATQRTGIEHNFQLADRKDAKALGVKGGAHLEATEKATGRKIDL